MNLATRGLSYPKTRLEVRLMPESEKSFQARVVQYARLTGWEVHHAFDSRHSSSGWPDLWLVRGQRLVAAELKREGERPRPEQERILGLLRRTNTEVHVWTPSDWNRILRVLGRHD